MPNAATLDVPEHNETLLDCDFWLNVADAPITIQKGMTYKWARPDGEEVELPIIGGFGSSTLIDSDDDVFHPEALQSLVDSAKIRMSTWRNHKFEVPYDNIGFIADEIDRETGKVIKRGLSVTTEMKDPARAAAIAEAYGGVAMKVSGDHGLMAIASTVNTAIRQSVDTYNAICNGSEFGWSIGAKYKNAKRRTSGRGVIRGFDVFQCAHKETSVVSLPANPLAWVDVARKSLIQRGVVPPSERDPEYAYVVKHWDDFDIPTKAELDGDELERVAIAKMLREYNDYFRENFGLVLAKDPNNRRLW